VRFSLPPAFDFQRIAAGRAGHACCRQGLTGFAMRNSVSRPDGVGYHRQALCCGRVMCTLPLTAKRVPLTAKCAPVFALERVQTWFDGAEISGKGACVSTFVHAESDGGPGNSGLR